MMTHIPFLGCGLALVPSVVGLASVLLEGSVLEEGSVLGRESVFGERSEMAESSGVSRSFTSSLSSCIMGRDSVEDGRPERKRQTC